MRLILSLLLILTPALTVAQSSTSRESMKSAPRPPGVAASTVREKKPSNKEKELPPVYRLQWSMEMGGLFIRDALANQRTQASAALNFRLDYDFTSLFSVNLNPRVSFRNGHVQSATSSNGRENSVELISAAAVLSDKDYFYIAAGALDMTAIHSSLLVANTFPGLRLQLSTGDREVFSAGLVGLAAVPSSATTTSNTRDYDKTPSFGSAGLRLSYRGESVEAMAQIAQFQYRDLPLNVATDSSLLGNTPLATETSPQSEFRYEFQGYEGRADLAFQIHPRFRYRLQLAAIQNAKAPSGYNQGTLLSNEAQILWSGRWMILPSFTVFRVEPDATVANYNNAMTTTNRIGYAAGMSFQYQKRFRFGALGGEREVLFVRSSQAREQFVNLILETFNVHF